MTSESGALRRVGARSDLPAAPHAAPAAVPPRAASVPRAAAVPLRLAMSIVVLVGLWWQALALRAAAVQRRARLQRPTALAPRTAPLRTAPLRTATPDAGDVPVGESAPQRPAPPPRVPAPRRPTADRDLAADPEQRLDAVAAWVGGPAGRGRVVPRAPVQGAQLECRVWSADGQLGVRRIRILHRLGAGLAGTVYLAQDDQGRTFVEKHYGAVPVEGGERLGRALTAAVYAAFRQAPLSFRELPAAVVTMHLANRLVVAASAARFGRPITPPLLYTRYDERTGGYVQAFAYVEGRPLRPTRRGLPLLGEMGTFLPLMRQWRDFLAHDLGLWGLARQVDPANANAASNLWVTPERHVVLLDLVPGVPGFLEPRYLWWGLRRGHLAPFADAVDLDRVRSFVDRSLSGRTPAGWDGELFAAAVTRWQDSEPRLPSSPLRLLRVVTDPRLRLATRRALLTHLEVKGVLSSTQAASYAATLAADGTFPAVRRHTLLKMSPLAVHRACVDARYAQQLVRRLPAGVMAVAAAGARTVAATARRAAAAAVLLQRHLTDRPLRLERFRTEVALEIADQERLGRLEPGEAAALTAATHRDGQTADLAGLFVVHVLVGAAKQALLGPSALWIALAVATGSWWWALPAAATPALRVAAAVVMGMVRHPGLLLLCALPALGVLAAPLYLLRRADPLGGFLLRVLATRAALAVPAFGQRGALAELGAVALVQVLVVGPARLLPVCAAVAAFGLALGTPALVGAAAAAYLLSAAAGAVAWRRRVVPGLEATWRHGLPDTPRSA